MAKHIFVTGGVVSGLGKGITAASVGQLLKARGLKVANQKFDPYINVDPGTMSPYQHGEVFVTEDGPETDLDLGHYERFIVARSEEPLSQCIKQKIALFSDVDPDGVICARDASAIHCAPLLMQKDGLDAPVVRVLNLECGEPDMSEWRGLVDKIDACDGQVTIALVGKYVQLHEAYLSVWEALKHSAIHHGRRLELLWIDSEDLTPDTVAERLGCADGVIVPGGFGQRGVEGKIAAIRYCRERKVPFLGVCLGMQCAVAEFARDLCDMAGANSTEFDPETRFPVIDLLPEQKSVEDMGGTMRLGASHVKLVPGTRAHAAYAQDEVWERHRHRYEVNNELRPRLEAAGLVISGTTADGRLVEICELPDHPWFVASQFHPEFKSRPTRPAPLFRDFVGAAARLRSQREDELEETCTQT